MSFLTQLLSEDNGNPSTMRMVTALIAIVIIGTWAYVSIVGRALAPLSVEQVSLLLGALGLKAFQKGKEESTSGNQEVKEQKEG